MNATALLLSLLTACQCGSGPETAPPGESGHSGDSRDSDPPATVEIRVQPVVPEDASLDQEITVAVVHVSFGDGPAIGETLVSGVSSGAELTLELPLAAPVDQLASLGNLYLPVSGSLYMLAAFVDDGDGIYQEGEPLLGVAMDRWVMWYHLDLDPQDSGQAVPVQSWRIVDLGIEGQYAPNRCALDSSWPLEWMMDLGYPQYHPTSDPIPLILRGLEASLGLEGAIVSSPQPTLRLAALPYPHVGEREVQSGFDVAIASDQESFAEQLSGAPPSEDDVGADPDWRYTMHLLLPFTDSDGSGAWTLGDALEGSSTCLDGELAWARYTRPIHSYRGYRFLDCYSGTVGWRLTHYADHGGVEYLSSDQARQLVLDFTDCRLD